MSNRPNLWRAIISILVVGGTLALTLTLDAKLGLDLKGGTEIVLQAQDTERVKADADATDRAIEILRGRVDSLGVAEPTIQRSGENRIIIDLPGLQDPRKAAQVIGQTAQLAFRQVIGPALIKPAQGQIVLPDESGTKLLLGPVALSGEDVKDANAATPQQGIGQWVVDVNFTGKGESKWQRIIATACANTVGGKRIAIVLDDTVISSPAAQEDLCASGGGASMSISGNFTQKSSKDLAILIKGGALPVPVKMLEQRTVGPTLGQSAIDASRNAAILGIIITGLFIVFVYRFVGLMAMLALCAYAVISFGLTVWLGVTLTLPGLAGFVLAIGLAIDANVLQFERSREEFDEKPSMGVARALEVGSPKAWPAIIDSTITTLIAAGLLFFLASGPVKGFGITLTIGTLSSLVSALVIARLLADLGVRIPVVRKHPAISGIGSIGPVRKWLNEKGPKITTKAGRWLIISTVVAVLALGGIVTRGLNLGVEFTGGRLLEYSSTKTMSPDSVREAIGKLGFHDAVVQRSSSDGANHNVSIRLSDITNQQAHDIERSLTAIGGTVTKESDQKISATLGSELKKKALIAFLIAITVQMLYLSWRFRWTYSVAAVTSLASVVLTVVGIFAWWGKPIDGVFLASILSIIGLVVHDTIIVFDRIREHSARNRGRNVREVLNEAILQTIPRTVNTVLCAMFILFALVIFGGDSLTDFAIALILGLGIGVVSTVFTAASLAAILEERWPYDEIKQKNSADRYAHIGMPKGEDFGDGAVV